MTLTLFNGQGNSKIPFSPYDDNTFIFVNKFPKNMKEAYEIIIRNFTLSKSLSLTEPIKVLRDKKVLIKYKSQKLDNISLNLTEIHSQYDRDTVIKYFEDNNYACVLGCGNQYNGNDNFHIQGIIKANLVNDEKTIRNSLLSLQSELGEICKVDLFSSSITSVQPPTNNSKILFSMENGKILRNINNTPVLSTKKLTGDLNDFTELCLETFYEMGFTPSNGKENKYGLLFYREEEGRKHYRWSPNNPMIMRNPKKNINIFHLLKNTKEGKKWLRDKTKEQQESQLIKTENLKKYKKTIIVEERYLNFEKPDKKKLIRGFLNSNKGVFKIKSPMGTAKSDGIKKIIEETHKRGEKIIVISNRISVAKDFSEKYSMLLYQDPNSVDSDDSIVVQYDSLYKYDLSKYDVVIFDEYISLLFHHRSNLNTNSNINAIKFKMLSEHKRVVIADAFLTGYDLEFFKGRDIFFVNNNYRDEVKLYEYSHKEKFIYELIQRAKTLKEEEHMSCSFTSLNIIKLVEHELNKENIKVISLTSETSELTRDIIYKKFKEKHHDSFQVILFTPTLTVGVSNLNSVSSHWHYDSSMGADVISSLQMIKRSRASEEINYFIQSRQNNFITDETLLNEKAEKNISRYYKSKDKTLLVDMDYETGELCLTPLARYINKIEAFYNIMANNHANAFRLLLGYQFKDVPLMNTEKSDFNIKDKIKEIKKNIKQKNMEILEKYSEIEYTEEEINYIKYKTTEKTEEEQAILMMNSIQSNFNKEIPKNKLKELTKLELESGGRFVQYIKNIHAVQKINSVDYTKYEISQAVSSDISSLQSKKHINFLENLLKFDGNMLDTSYTKLQINQFNQNLFGGKRKFLKFLSELGYKWDSKSERYESDMRVFSFINYL